MNPDPQQPTPQPPPPAGVEQAHVIDQIVHDPHTDEVVMVMVERRPWNGTDLQLFQLQEKFNAYLSFILDGEMAETYPALAGKRVRLRLECVQRPEESVLAFLCMARDQIAYQGIELEVIVGEGGCGPGCACA